MLNVIYEYLVWFLGLDQGQLTILHMIARALVIYIFGTLIIVLDRRIIGEQRAFDTIVRFIVGAALAKAIVGSAPYFATLGMTLFLLCFNWVFAFVSFYSKNAEAVLKGSVSVLYSNGQFQLKEMKRHFISKADIMSAIRRHANVGTLKVVDKVLYENTGEISVVLKNQEQISCQAYNS